ncbi:MULTISPECIES: LysR family transcriptional regulator [Shewanella]|jgi:LysR family L-lactate utilization transcriptional regulator|uniref:Transcriptional regulator, LysR family n=1 Tax=Shewanella baltica (strain OS155 / ATCC BAA-1091) TaxID=325240 RepID=A3D7B9_SHEB5|nr:LysR family transcriptional regulator [Shewanella baltica]ABN62632.1 transcriptional regulator, LysR family [Shewanella baltica OS155]AEH14970.1 transcriptional regulator, LysR family [Shewanella baltica OS117]MCS6177454.1 LysR family transcriptional regulator [Shewanella baltica]MCS6253663.1 LysR family transcriptional regulator [Shewanella baltica]
MSDDLGAELQLVYLFVHLVNAGSFSQAAKELDMPIATVSRKLAKLEEKLDKQLFMRSTRKLRLTEEGLALFQRYQSVVAQFDELSGAGSDKPEGTLRIAAPISIISIVFIQALNEFGRLYPDIRLHISQSNELVDLIDKGIDVAIVGGAQPDSSWVSSTLGELDYCLFATPEYLAQAPKLEHPDDLEAHQLIKVWPLFNWHLKHPSGESFYFNGPTKLTLTDLHGAIQATLGHGGILYGPELFVKQQIKEGKLNVLLPEWIGEQRRISILYHQRSQQPLKVRVFIEFMQSKAPELFSMR